MITLDDIGYKEFANVANGYNPEEVDDFLDALSVDYAAALNENETLKKKIEELNAKIEELSATSRPGYLKMLESTVDEAIKVAQRKADEAVAQAQATADTTVANAEEQARTIVATAKEEAGAARIDLEQLKKAASEYRSGFQRLVLEQVNILKSGKDLFGEE